MVTRMEREAALVPPKHESYPAVEAVLREVFPGLARVEEILEATGAAAKCEADGARRQVTDLSSSAARR